MNKVLKKYLDGMVLTKKLLKDGKKRERKDNLVEGGKYK